MRIIFLTWGGKEETFANVGLRVGFKLFYWLSSRLLVAEQMQCGLCIHQHDRSFPYCTILSGLWVYNVGLNIGLKYYGYFWEFFNVILLTLVVNVIKRGGDLVGKLIIIGEIKCGFVVFGLGGRHSMGRNGRSLIAKRWHLLHMLAYRGKLPSLHTFRTQVWWMRISDAVPSSSILMAPMQVIR